MCVTWGPKGVQGFSVAFQKVSEDFSWLQRRFRPSETVSCALKGDRERFSEVL